LEKKKKNVGWEKKKIKEKRQKGEKGGVGVTKRQLLLGAEGRNL